MRLLLVVLALPLWGAEDANAIISRLIAAEDQNRAEAQQYTYTEEIQRFVYDKNGQAKEDKSETYDILFVEGLQYRRLVARDGNPLSQRDEAREDKKLQQTSEERRKQRKSGIFRKVVSIGTSRELLTLFDNRLIGEEEMRGRKVWVIESTPQPGRIPANQHEKEVLSFRKKHWIDQSENIYLKRVDTVIGNQIVIKPGTVITFEFDKVNDAVWLPLSTVANTQVQPIKFAKFSGRTESQFSNYKKFDVASTITVEGPK